MVCVSTIFDAEKGLVGSTNAGASAAKYLYGVGIPQLNRPQVGLFTEPAGLQVGGIRGQQHPVLDDVLLLLHLGVGCQWR